MVLTTILHNVLNLPLAVLAQAVPGHKASDAVDRLSCPKQALPQHSETTFATPESERNAYGEWLLSMYARTATLLT